MASNFELFKQQLDEAVGLIENSCALELPSPQSCPMSEIQFADTDSLLARCELVCEQFKSKKPTIRVIHHLACSGGTLISKCISAMPNVYLLSEVHPYTDLAIDKTKPKYAPSDLSSLSKYAGIPQQKELAAKLFKDAVATVHKHVESHGGTLVLRDHTHADFNTLNSIPEISTVVSLLQDDYDIKSILTIRDPVDSYASLVKNGWLHFKPNDFDEYCRRLILLVERFAPERVFRYEDFLTSPKSQMQAISEALEIPYDEAFEEVFSIFKVTGDSGRSSDTIDKRPRIAPKDIVEKSCESEYYEYFSALKFGR